MEEVDVVIVGAGIAGLATSLGLHRLGIPSLVLESSESLRTSGYALGMWTNAWTALDALGVGDSLRQKHPLIQGIVATSAITGVQASSLPIDPKGESGKHELRCVKRNVLLETLAEELPVGTIKFSSKVVSIEEYGFYKLIHLADGTILKIKVLIGCDGVNSVVAKWLGFKKAAFTRRSAIRGFLTFEFTHGFEPKAMQFLGDGVRSGIIPCDDNTVYWFFTWTPSKQEREIEDDDHVKLKELVLSRLGKIPEEKRKVIEETQLTCFTSAPLRYRRPWEVLWGNIYKGNVCVAGDALHPMTPDIGQGGSAALEDGVVLARCLGQALLKKPEEGGDAKEYQRIEKGLGDYAKERKWRSFELISTAFVVGHVQQSHGKVMKFLRDKVFAGFLARLFLRRAEYNCGKLITS